MKRKYKRICYSDRKNIEKLFKSKMPIIKIAKIIGVSRAAIYLEKNKGWDEATNQYSAELAQKNYGDATKNNHQSTE